MKWLVLIMTTLLLAACGSERGTSPLPDSADLGPFQGRAVDPYIEGAMFKEVTADGRTRQFSGRSDAEGLFRFSSTVAPGSTLEMLPATGATHNFAPYRGLLKRKVGPEDDGILTVSPLTTLLANGIGPEDLLRALAEAGLDGLDAADLTADPMAGLSGLSRVDAGQLRLLQANMTAQALMALLKDFDLGPAAFSRPANRLLLQDLGAACREVLDPQRLEQLIASADQSGEQLLLDDLIGMAAHVMQRVSDLGGMPSRNAIMSVVQADLAQAGELTRQYRSRRLETPAPVDPDGQAIFLSQCAGCHAGGLTGAKVQAKFGGNASHMGKTLSAAQIAALGAYFDGGGPEPGPGPNPGPAPGNGTASGDAQALFNSQCAACHNIGGSGNLFDLGGDGAKIQGKFAGGASHSGGVLSGEQIAALATLVDGSAPGDSPSGQNPGPGQGPACGSCHGIPPGGAEAGAHAKHLALPGITCDSCHSRIDLHLNGTVDVDIAGFDSRSGKATAIYDPARNQTTCSNVSCHGGHTTPAWTGTLNTANCQSCHVLGTSSGNPEFNSYFSGRHRKHVVDKKYACGDCHNPAKLAETHFRHLGTPVLEGSARGTIGGTGTRVNFYNADATCAAACHGTGKGSWFR